MEAKLRRYQYILGTAGFGVLVFCIWSMIKAAMFAFLQRQEYVDTPVESTEVDSILEEGLSEAVGMDITTFFILIFVALIILGILDIILRIYIGRTARKVSRGKKKRPVYLVFAIILAALNLIAMIHGVMSSSYLSGSYLDTVITFVIDLTSLGALIAVIISGFQVRRLTRLLEKQKKKEEAVCS